MVGEILEKVIGLLQAEANHLSRQALEAASPAAALKLAQAMRLRVVAAHLRTEVASLEVEAMAHLEAIRLMEGEILPPKPTTTTATATT
jgi:hypothetical protein